MYKKTHSLIVDSYLHVNLVVFKWTTSEILFVMTNFQNAENSLCDKLLHNKKKKFKTNQKSLLVVAFEHKIVVLVVNVCYKDVRVFVVQNNIRFQNIRFRRVKNTKLFYTRTADEMIHLYLYKLKYIYLNVYVFVKITSENSVRYWHTACWPASQTKAAAT